MIKVLYIAAYTLLKPKCHSLHCHGFMVHALLLRMHPNVVYFRVMRRLCRRILNWLCVNLHPWQRTCDHSVWRQTLTAYWKYRELLHSFWGLFFFGGGGGGGGVGGDSPQPMWISYAAIKSQLIYIQYTLVVTKFWYKWKLLQFSQNV